MLNFCHPKTQVFFVIFKTFTLTKIIYLRILCFKWVKIIGTQSQVLMFKLFLLMLRPTIIICKIFKIRNFVGGITHLMYVVKTLLRATTSIQQSVSKNSAFKRVEPGTSRLRAFWSTTGPGLLPTLAQKAYVEKLDCLIEINKLFPFSKRIFTDCSKH